MRFDNSYYKISMLRLVFATLLLGSVVGVNGQDAFHRIFPSNDRDNLFVLGGTQLKDGGYATLNIIVTDEGEADASRAFIITKYEKKGDVRWNFKFTLPEVNGEISPSNCALIQSVNDSLYFTLATETLNGPALILGSISSGGTIGKIKTISTLEDAYDYASTLGHHLALGKSGFYTGFQTENPTLAEAHISKYDSKGAKVFTKGLTAKDAQQNFYQDLRRVSNKGGNLAFTGIIDSNNVKPYIAVMDTLGKMKWSKVYSDNEFDLGISIPVDIVELKDSSFIITGVSLEIDVNSFVFKGFVLKTTKTGEVDWSKKIIFNDGDFTYGKFVEVNLKDEIVLSGFNVDVQNQQIFDYLIKLDLTGKVIWQKKYLRATTNGSVLGDLVPTSDSGMMLFTTVIDDDLQAPSMIKTNVDGSTTCEDEITDIVLFDNSYSTDTLLWNVRDVGLYEKEIFVEDDSYIFNVPTIKLEPKMFCEKEQVNHLFRSPIKGATNYKWSTGAEGKTLDSLRVMALGDYSLTVTVEDKVCYILCADVKLEAYPLPQLAMGDVRGNFCTNGKKTVFESYQPGHPVVKSIIWNTGETNIDRIEVGGTGTYMVTVTDQCDEKAVGVFTLNEFPKKITAVNLTGEARRNCFTGRVEGTVTASGNGVGGDVLPEKYLWSTGATTPSINIGSEMVSTYTVTVTDDCGNTASAVYVPKDGEGIASVQITTSTEVLCDEGILRLNAVANRPGTLSYTWSTGETTAAVIVDKAGTYIVTVTDLCGNTATETAEVSASDFAPEKMRFAKVFFPEGLGMTYEDADSLSKVSVLLNRTFGPINKAEYCLKGVTDYEFYIYNRWGQTVFETNDVDKEWDGRIDGKQSASDTYVYVARYKVNGVELVQKGDVDLIR